MSEALNETEMTAIDQTDEDEPTSSDDNNDVVADSHAVESEETPEAADPGETPEAIEPDETPEAVEPDETPEAADPDETPEAIEPEETPEAADPDETPEAVEPEESPEPKESSESPEPQESPDELDETPEPEPDEQAPSASAASTASKDTAASKDTPASQDTTGPAAPSEASPGVATKWKLIAGALLLVVAAAWGTFEAIKVRGQLVDGTLLTPEMYLAQVVPIEVDGAESPFTLEELGWSTQSTDARTGRLFARQRVHTPVEPSGGPAESPTVLAYQSELERDPTAPVIDRTWKVVEGEAGVATEVTVDGSDPPERITVASVAIEPESSAPLKGFIQQRNRGKDGWELNLINRNGVVASSFSAEEIAAHVRFDRETATVEVVEQAELETLLDEKLLAFVEGGQQGRFELEATEDEATPIVKARRLNVTDVLTEPQPGKIADPDQAWTDVIDAIKSLRLSLPIETVDGEDLYGGVDPATLVVKLAESRTPNTGGGRMTNIRNVLDTTRGIVVEPGGVFGINQTVGRRTVENGYVTAGAIANGEHVEAFGGGISQTATMFHQAAYMAGLTFPEREGGGIGGGHQTFGHSEYFGRYNDYYAEGWGLDGRMDTGRLGRGVEQTVNWPNREAGFINTTPHPILVWTFDVGDQVGVSLWSVERDRFGVYEGTDSWRRGSCNDWTHYRTVYDMDDNVLFEDKYNGFYRTQGPTCALLQPDDEDEGGEDGE